MNDNSDSDNSNGSDDKRVDVEGVDVDEINECKSKKENAVPVDEVENSGMSCVAYIFEVVRSLTQEAYYIRSEDNLKLEYNIEIEEEIYYTILIDLEANLCKVVKFTE